MTLLPKAGPGSLSPMQGQEWEGIYQHQDVLALGFAHVVPMFWVTFPASFLAFPFFQFCLGLPHCSLHVLLQNSINSLRLVFTFQFPDIFYLQGLAIALENCAVDQRNLPSASLQHYT